MANLAHNATVYDPRAVTQLFCKFVTISDIVNRELHYHQKQHNTRDAMPLYAVCPSVRSAVCYVRVLCQNE